MSETPSVSSTPTPTPGFIALASQVGGHAGVETTEDGSLIIKPVLQRELQFYQALQQDPTLAALLPFTAKFLGTLKLEGTVDPTKPDSTEGIIMQPVKEAKESMVLENLTFGFLKPNILDVKLGTVLYDDNASPDKVARMEKTARDTTSFETGVRLTGFQVYDNITSLPVNTPKLYGKTIKPHQLSEGIAKFFPVASDSNSSTDIANDASTLPSSSSSSSSGLPRNTLIRILRALREEIALIREAYSALELRMVGGSLLIVYEADWERAEEGIKNYLEGNVNDADADTEMQDVSVYEGLNEKEKENEDGGVEDGDEDENEEDEDEDDDDDETLIPPFVVKLIDFAHTSVAPGKGPDEGVLLGIDTILRLLDGRLSELAVFS
ncbi:hypothetical protein M413DRAFT_438862 [Hebeloma cylindrosporum]|uniref:Kinase n=1 Tax=Hebeloma cylindrosporum TaxID=76867 RepID=A0A0C3CLZ1_HEBCY|nr:hypothetical protein M413DRAFT_438862 [Hebeloma cylindrosporum h7]